MFDCVDCRCFSIHTTLWMAYFYGHTTRSLSWSTRPMHSLVALICALADGTMEIIVWPIGMCTSLSYDLHQYHWSRNSRSFYLIFFLLLVNLNRSDKMECKRLWCGKDYANCYLSDYTNHDPFVDCLDRFTQPRLPWHDIGVVVTGASARDVARHFIQRWNASKEAHCYAERVRNSSMLWIPHKIPIRSDG